MESYGMPVEGYPLSELPFGIGMAMALNVNAMQSYAGLSETEKEHLLMRCRDARSGEELQKIVDSVVPSDAGEVKEKIFSTSRHPE